MTGDKLTRVALSVLLTTTANWLIRLQYYYSVVNVFLLNVSVALKKKLKMLR